ncbi:class IV lanthionine synthetase LanL [Embleya sp. NPDC008237]|uniref:class IV lanthionine synthetase LanL n=1 Tax=Embleya sp. NPDC008237 TaxID=3363978 RepID=UPI0036EEA731
MSSYRLLVARVLAETNRTDSWRVWHGDPWCMVSPPGHVRRRQGWKLHLSATARSAPDVLERAARVLVAHGCAFKFAADPDVAAELNAVRAARARSGKFITAYPADDEQLVLLAAELHAATEGLPGPAILSDRRYRPGSVVHYRFGCFARPRELNDEGFYEGRLQAPDGTSEPDRREAWFSPPPWAVDPLAVPGPRHFGRRRGDSVLLARRYRVREAIRHSNRGGVYRAHDERTGEQVLIKEARPHVGAGPDGRDARDWLRHEAQVLTRLAPRRIAPEPREVFDSAGHVFLVEELIEGISLTRWTADRLERRHGDDGRIPVAAGWELARELTRLLAQVHAESLVLRDFKPGNVMMTPKDCPMLVDLESAVAVGSRVPAVGTRGFTAPEYLGAAGSERAVPAADFAADCFSLGATLLQVGAGINPVLAAESAPARPVGERIAAIVAAAAPALPMLRALAPLIVGLTGEVARRWTLEQAADFLRAEPDPTRPLGIRPPAPVDPDRLLTDGPAHLADTMDPDAEYLWPAPRSLPDGDPCNVQLGAAGVLAVLDRAVRCGRRDAEPALRTAAHWLDRRLTRPDRVLPGLYFGRSGTAWALYEAARTLADDALAERAAAYALAIPLIGTNPDVCHGLAGAGTAQLHLWHATGDRRFAERAGQCADAVLRLLAAAEAGVDWPVGPEVRAELAGSALYGFGHGVAGNATFLLSAGRDLDRPELIDIAVGGAHALAAVADRRGGVVMWPKGPGRTERPGLDFWCNGTSGVGTFLVRLWQVTGTERWLDLAEGAACAVYADRWRIGPGSCHGVAGNAELLLDLYAATGDERHRSRAHELGGCIAVRAAHRHGRWLVPDDTMREMCAAYGVGMAGVLDFLLRLEHGGPRSWLVDRPATGHDRDPRKGEMRHGELRSGTSGTAGDR